MKDNENINEIVEMNDIYKAFLEDEDLIDTVAAGYNGGSEGSGAKWNYACKY